MKGMTEFFRGAGAKKRTVPLLSLILMVCLLLGGSNAFAAQVAYYPLDGNANDSSANGLNGTVNGATLTTNRFGNGNSAYSFNGTSNYISVADNDALDPAAITIAAWVNPTNLGSGGQIVSKGDNAGYRLRIIAQGGNTTGYTQLLDRGGTNTLSSAASSVPFGAWTHVAAVGDASGLKVYINGVLSTSNSTAYGAPNTASSMTIGARDVLTTEFFDGIIDDVRIYNTALSASEIWTLAYLTGGSIQGGPLNLTIGHSDVTTLAGLAGSAGGTDGTGSAARFSSPHGLTTDGTNLYVADHDGYVIRKIVISTGQVTTIAGTYGSAGSTDGTGSAARFNKPTAMATDGVNLYVADYNNHTVRKIVLSTGVVTTLAGSAGLAGSTDGTGSAARFNYPNGLTMIGGYLYLSEMGNHTIRRINISTAAVTTFAGSAGLTGTTDATGTAARFNTPCGVTTDGTNLYVVDLNNYTVRKIVISSAAVTTQAGTAGVSNWLDGTGTAAQFKGIEMITTDGTYLYVSDWGSSTIRRITISSGVVTTIAGSNGLSGSTDGLGSAARFFTNEGLTTDGTNLFIADRGNNTIRKISYVNSAPVITSNGGGATASVSVSENQTAVTTVTTTDTNSDTITYSTTGGSDSAKFSINSSTGVLTFVSAPDYENPTDSDANNTYIVMVQASDGSLTDSQTITVTVTNVNEAPVITSNGGGATAAISVSENQTAVTTVTSTDPEGQARTYLITGGTDSAKFSINSSTGVLTFVSAPDYENPTDSDANNTYIVTVQASDGSLSDSQTITVTVTNVNEAPAITSNGGGATAAISVAENQTAVTTVTATDADSTPTFSITGGSDSAKFSINTSTGVLTFASAPNYEVPTDSDTNNTYVVTVQASDGTLTDSQTITVTVTDVDDTAPDTSITANPTNPSSSGDATFSFTATEPSTYQCQMDSGGYSSCTSPKSYTGLTAGNHTFYVKATDAAGNTDATPASYAWTITGIIASYPFDGNANDSSGNGNNGTLMNGATFTTGRYDQGVSFDGFDGLVTTDLPVTSPSTVSTSLWFNTSSASGSKIIGLEGGYGYYDYNLYVGTDGKLRFGIWDSAARVVTSQNVVTDGNWHHAAAIFQNNIVSLYLDGVSQGTLSTNGSNAFTGYWQMGGGQLNAWPNGSNGNYNGLVDDVRIYNKALSAGEILALAHPPVITSDGGGATASVNAAENQTAVTTVTATDSNNDSITYSITGGSDSAKFAINSSTGVLTFISAPDYENPTDSDTNNTYVVNVTVSDGALTDVQTITVTVTDVLDAPDTTPPITTPSVSGGTYTSSQSVILTPNESATTYYCTGSGCNPTTVGTSVSITGSTVLRYYSKDTANNSETVKTENYTIAAAGLNYNSGDTGSGGLDNRAAITRSDDGNDADNLDSGKARFDLLYNFTVFFIDDTGTPQIEPKLYIANKSNPVAGDLFKYDLTCTGASWAAGKSCTTEMPLGPAAAHKYYFTARKFNGVDVRLPASGYLDGPMVKTLNGWSIISATRDIDSANLSASAVFGRSSAYKWVSTGLDPVPGVVFSGYWQAASSIKKGVAYFVSGSSGTLPELAAYSDTAAATTEITLQPGWNLIATPYNGNVRLSDVMVRKGAEADQTWNDATANAWLPNSIWNYQGTDWGGTYWSDSAGGSPDAVLAPWMGYWIYLNKTDDTYRLIIPKPVQ